MLILQVDHGLTKEEIETQFDTSRRYFSLPREIKQKIPHSVKTGNGFEYKAQFRPSTNSFDQKESLWLQRYSQWPDDEDVAGVSHLFGHVLMWMCLADEVLASFEPTQAHSWTNAQTFRTRS